ncbi:MAG TPA: hypothetical protein VE152_05680, partial [Acidimicrobiales bacterium]|nr:hypothetical protein [Acidimicrobiales bacterium]
MALGLLALAAGACGGTTVVTRPAATTRPPPSTAPATTAPAQAATIGSTLALSVPGGGSIAVALQAVVDPAQAANEFLSPPAGTRLVGARLRITNTGRGTYDDNANNATNGRRRKRADLHRGPLPPGRVHQRRRRRGHPGPRGLLGGLCGLPGAHRRGGDEDRLPPGVGLRLPGRPVAGAGHHPAHHA